MCLLTLLNSVLRVRTLTTLSRSQMKKRRLEDWTRRLPHSSGGDAQSPEPDPAGSAGPAAPGRTLSHTAWLLRHRLGKLEPRQVAARRLRSDTRFPGSLSTPTCPGPGHSRAPSTLTCGHEERDAELAAQHPGPQVLQRAPVERQGAAHQHVEDHAEALRPKHRACR